MKFSHRREPVQPRPRTAASALERMPEDVVVPFSVEDDIYPEEIEAAMKELGRLKYMKASWEETKDDFFDDWEWSEAIAKLVQPLAVLFHNRKEELGLEQYWPLLKEELDSKCSVSTFNLTDVDYTVASALILLDPRRRQELTQLNNPELREDRKKKQLTPGIRSTLGGLLVDDDAIEYGIVFPQYSNELPHSDEAWALEKEVFEQYVAEGNMGATCRKGLFLKLYFPHRAHELVLSQDLWDAFRKQLHSSSAESSNFWGKAMAMAVLASGKAEFTKEGFIQLTPRQPTIQKSKSLPQRRHV